MRGTAWRARPARAASSRSSCPTCSSSADPVLYLYLYLYLNAFSHSRAFRSLTLPLSFCCGVLVDPQRTALPCDDAVAAADAEPMDALNVDIRRPGPGPSPIVEPDRTGTTAIVLLSGHEPVHVHGDAEQSRADFGRERNGTGWEAMRPVRCAE